MFLSYQLEAQKSSFFNPKIYYTSEIMAEKPPTIDGVLNDSVWKSVNWGSDFIEVSPDENTNPSVQTKFKILYDQKIFIHSLKSI